MILLSSFFVAPAFADVEILPELNDVVIEPGKTQEYTIKLKNNSPTDEKAKLRLIPYEGLDEKEWGKIKDWIYFINGRDEENKELELNLRGNSEKNIHFRVAPPKDAKIDGAQYATISLETEKNNAKATIYGENPDSSTRSGEIMKTDIPAFSMGGKVKGTIDIKNTGNTSLTVTEEMEIQSLYDKVQTVLNENATLLPGETKTIEQEWQETPAFGIFKVTYNIYILGEKTSISGAVAIIPAWMIMIFIAGALSLTGLIYIGIKKLVKK